MHEREISTTNSQQSKEERFTSKSDDITAVTLGAIDISHVTRPARGQERD